MGRGSRIRSPRIETRLLWDVFPEALGGLQCGGSCGRSCTSTEIDRLCSQSRELFSQTLYSLSLGNTCSDVACCLNKANKMMFVQPFFFFCHKRTSFPANFAVCFCSNRTVDASTPRNVVSVGAAIMRRTSMVTACTGHVLDELHLR